MFEVRVWFAQNNEYSFFLQKNEYSHIQDQDVRKVT